MPITHQEFLDRIRIFDNVYYVGAFQPPLTFLSQQHRALNLIWALEQDRFDFQGKSIAILGAGFAGLTAASALYVLGSAVTIFEQASTVIPMQQGNATRFVMPHLYEWPTPGSAYPRTHLPFLNWDANSAGDIAQQVIHQWNRIGQPIVPNATVKSVRVVGSNPLIKFSNLPPRHDFDMVFVAVGFGIEGSKLSGHTPPYWRNDDLTQPVISDGEFRWLVSGIGDGALLDALRVRLENFDHGDFLVQILRNDWLCEQAKEIEAEIMAGHKQSEVWTRFLSKTIPAEVEELFQKQQRPRTRVVLSANHPMPMDGDALLSNKIAIALLWKLGLVEYKRWKLSGVRRLTRDRFQVRVATRKLPLEFNRVIARHGTRETLKPIIGARRLKEMKSSWRREPVDETAQPQYPSDFLSDRFMPLNMEAGFEVVFALGTSFDRDRLSDVTDAEDRLISVLDLLGKQLDRNNFAQEFVEGGNVISATRTIPWRGLSCSFEVKRGVIETWRGRCGGPLIVASTNYRSVLDALLRGDLLPYHSFGYLVTNAALEGPQNLFARDLETNAIIFDNRNPGKRLTVRRHYGMYQAHRLFSVQSLIEILHNDWSISRLQRIGWLIGDKEHHLRRNWTIG